MDALATSGGSLALMYHALSADGCAVAGQDPHYTLPADGFQKQLDACASHGRPVVSARDWLAGPRRPATLLSFDDGHISNYELAFPLLIARDAGADFFINSATVGRAGYCGWQQLREMADAGMSIQSHSHEHTYLTSYDAATLRAELTRSRKLIEDAIGKPVTLLAPPGGRMPANLADVARGCGYEHILSSKPGLVKSAAAFVLPRMAVTAKLDMATLNAWLRGDILTFAKARLRYAVLAGMKRLLGDDGYERLRREAVRGSGKY
ncbi:MAG: polysaccharide deacetylase family protein [Dokdonella sp.]